MVWASVPCVLLPPGQPGGEPVTRHGGTYDDQRRGRHRTGTTDITEIGPELWSYRTGKGATTWYSLAGMSVEVPGTTGPDGDAAGPAVDADLRLEPTPVTGGSTTARVAGHGQRITTNRFGRALTGSRRVAIIPRGAARPAWANRSARTAVVVVSAVLLAAIRAR